MWNAIGIYDWWDSVRECTDGWFQVYIGKVCDASYAIVWLDMVVFILDVLMLLFFLLIWRSARTGGITLTLTLKLTLTLY